MRISELASAADLPVATVKYYLRSGLVPAGVRTSATQATYDQAHLERLRLVRALIDGAGLTHAQVRSVLDALESSDSLLDSLATVHDALPPTVSDQPTEGRGRRLLERWGWSLDLQSPALAQLDRALDVVAASGLPADDERLDAYAAAARQMAESEIDGMPRGSREEALTYTVLGTVLYEPVVLALRRVAEAQVSMERFGR